MARHQTANPNQGQRRHRRHDSETMQPAIIGRFSHSKVTLGKANRCEERSQRFSIQKFI
jgi:hypothetical protein